MKRCCDVQRWRLHEEASCRSKKKKEIIKFLGGCGKLDQNKTNYTNTITTILRAQQKASKSQSKTSKKILMFLFHQIRENVECFSFSFLELEIFFNVNKLVQCTYRPIERPETSHFGFRLISLFTQSLVYARSWISLIYNA